MMPKEKTFLVAGAIVLFAVAAVFINSVHGFTHPTFPPPTGTAGPIPIVNGGTGATTTANARNNLGGAASGANSDITSLTPLSGVLNVFGQLKLNDLLTLPINTSAPTVCDSSNSGAIYFNDTDKSVYDCNATSWTKLGSMAPVTGTITYATPGAYTWTVPDGVSRVLTQIWGGGGGGGGGNGGNGYCGGGGGGSGAYSSYLLVVTTGNSFSITVGAGGTGGAGGPGGVYPSYIPSSGISGSSGGSSVISWGSYSITASGGGAGRGGQYIAGNPCVAGSGGSGGSVTQLGSNFYLVSKYLGESGGNNLYYGPGGYNGGGGASSGGASGTGFASSDYVGKTISSPSSDGGVLQDGGNGGYGGNGGAQDAGCPSQDSGQPGASGGSPGGGAGGGGGAACGVSIGGNGGSGGSGKIILWW